MSSPIIVALDLERDAAIQLASRLDPNLCKLKVGNELFTSSGPQVVLDLKSKGFDIFLDLKFHDIPNTVASAVREACELGVWMVNVHASGGSKMMASAADTILDYESKPILIGVTVLTSIGEDEASSLGINHIESHTLSLAKLAKQSGLDGIVCSPQEVKKIKEDCGNDFIAVTPGIRPSNTEDDQTRISTPKQAIANGSDYLVIGRPITRSADPLASLKSILNEIT